MSLSNYNIEDLHIAKSALTDKVYAGFLSADKKTWNKKKDITAEFAKVVVDVYSGAVTSFYLNDKKYQLRLVEIEDEEE